tara:strand:- start:1110 stop:1448 length:339 start_codon:yes stop_codon:yes gene_type:complete
MTETWSLEELKALTSEVASEVITYRGKDVKVQWCELTEAEEPKIDLVDETASEEEKNAMYQKIGTEKVKSMINKADGMSEEKCGLASVWEDLPTTLRYQLTAKVLGAQTPDF